MSIMVWDPEKTSLELVSRTWEMVEGFREGQEEEFFPGCELFLDLDPMGLKKRGPFYARYPQVPILANTVERTLKYFWQSSWMDRPSHNVFGLNAWPTFLGRPLAEISVMEDSGLNELEKLMGQLDWAFRTVPDQVGMVTPRVVAMMINEAYFTLQDGTASKSDIDLAMRLGTQYPFGPFEWSQKIGLGRICRLMSHLKKETGDSRYQVCSLLEKESLDDLHLF
ncbi:MAG: 3-hydroxyacyl-CoA dehydrogenase family protein [Chitinophagaceae bacterium]